MMTCPGNDEENMNVLVPDVSARKLFMVHIPKTAGTTINHLITVMLGPKRVRIHIEGIPGFLKDIESLPPEVKYVSGHHRLPVVLAHLARPNWFVFATLRNPVEHLVSHLKHVKALAAPGSELRLNESSSSIREIALRLWEISLNDVEALRKVIYEGSGAALQLFDNCEVRYMIESRDRPIVCEDAQEALRALGDLDFVGFQDDISTTYTALSDVLGKNTIFRAVPRTNKSLLDETVDINDPKVRDFYQEAVQWDTALYDRAKELFTKHVAAS